MDEISERAKRRTALAASLAGEDTPTDLTACLPRRVAGTHYTPPPIQRFIDPSTDVEYLLCDGGFHALLAAAESISAAQRRRQELEQ